VVRYNYFPWNMLSHFGMWGSGSHCEATGTKGLLNFYLSF
jgi:hypothetical protein